MFEILKARLQQKYRTLPYPDGPAPSLSERFAGRPEITAGGCEDGCRHCVHACPVEAVCVDDQTNAPRIDTGRCLFCRACEKACPRNAICFGQEYRLAASRRQDLVTGAGALKEPPVADVPASRLFGRSLKLRQVSAGGCNACEADCNVLNTLAWDVGRFGIQFVASPRHADGLLITGPVTANMRLALEKTYEAVPYPKIVIALGGCAIAGGPYSGLPEVCNGVDGILPVDLYVPGCPPQPLTILDGLLRLLKKVK